MISLEDCIALCGLTAQEVQAIAEHEHVPDIVAAAMGRYLLKAPGGPQQICAMMRDDIHAALDRGDKQHASELLTVLRQFLDGHPEARPSPGSKDLNQEIGHAPTIGETGAGKPQRFEDLPRGR